MRRRGWIGLVGGALFLGVLAAAWLFLAPPRLGGQTSYALVVGSSMEPRPRRGDLVLVRRAGDYRVGEVVLYRSRLLGRDVLHRIVRREGERFVFKGDNNGFLDSDRPTKADLVGRLWLRLPAVGGALGWLRRPAAAALVVGLAALLALGVGGGAAARGRRGRARGVGPGEKPASSLLGQGAEVALVLSLLAALAFGALAAAAYSRPERRSVAWNAYRQEGRFTYTAAARVGPVYPRGTAVTGQPVFLRLAGPLSVGFAYRFQARSRYSVAGRARLLAQLADPGTGWRRTLTLQPWTRFRGDRARVRGTVRLRELAALLVAFEARTGLQSASYTYTLRPQVVLGGTVAGRAFSDRFQPPLRFELDPLVLRLAPSTAGGGPKDSLAPAKVGSLRRLGPARLGIGGLRLEVARARRLSPLGGGISLGAALALAALLAARRLRGDEPSRIAVRYGSLLLAVEAVPWAEGERTVEVASIEELARLAEAAEQPILHTARDGSHSYLVAHGGVLYRYRAREREAAAQAPSEPPAGGSDAAPEQEPPPEPIQTAPVPPAPGSRARRSRGWRRFVPSRRGRGWRDRGENGRGTLDAPARSSGTSEIEGRPEQPARDRTHPEGVLTGGERR